MGGMGPTSAPYIAMPVEWQWCSQDLSTWDQSEGPKRPSVGYMCVCVRGGGGILLPHGREIFEIICIQIAFFGTLKDLL